MVARAFNCVIILESKYLKNLELLVHAFANCYGCYAGDKVTLKHSLHNILLGSIKLFDKTATKLKSRPIIDIDRDVDYRHWGKLETWTERTKKPVDPSVLESLHHLRTILLEIADTIDSPPYDNQQYEYLYLLSSRSYNTCHGARGAQKYAEWKSLHITSDIPEYSYVRFVDESVAGLLCSGVFDGIKANASKQDLNSYQKDFDFEPFDCKQKKTMLSLYCRFRNIYAKHGDLYSIKTANAGRLIFRLRKEPDKLKTFFHFEHTLNLVNADVNKLRNTDRTGSIKDDIDFSQLPCRFSDEEVQKSGIKKHAKVVLAVMDHMQDKAVSKSYWLVFYCVLLDMGWIEDNLGGFCTNMNRLFGLKLDNSSFAKTRKSLGSDIKNWPEDDKRIEKKKLFGLRFEAYLDFYQRYRMQIISHEFH